MPFRIKKGAPKDAAWGLPEGDSSGFGWVREFESGAAPLVGCGSAQVCGRLVVDWVVANEPIDCRLHGRVE